MVDIRSSIHERLPSILPSGLIDVENERHEFDYVDDENTAAKTVYSLNKAPFTQINSLEGTVDGRRRTIPESAYETRNVGDSDGDDAIAFVDTEYYPDPGTEFSVSYRIVPLIERYVTAFDGDIDDVDDEIDDVIRSHQIDNASGQELDLLASYFGLIGERSGRSDNDYTVLLKSIVPSFSARGTKPGMKFAISTAVGAEPEDITITEDFQAVGYEIQVEDSDLEFVTTAVTDIAELADPSGVELLNDPVIVLGEREITLTSTGSSVVSQSSGLGDNTEEIGGAWTL